MGLQMNAAVVFYVGLEASNSGPQANAEVRYRWNQFPSLILSLFIPFNCFYFHAIVLFLWLEGSTVLSALFE